MRATIPMMNSICPISFQKNAHMQPLQTAERIKKKNMAAIVKPPVMAGSALLMPTQTREVVAIANTPATAADSRNRI